MTRYQQERFLIEPIINNWIRIIRYSFRCFCFNYRDRPKYIQDGCNNRGVYEASKKVDSWRKIKSAFDQSGRKKFPELEVFKHCLLIPLSGVIYTVTLLRSDNVCVWICAFCAIPRAICKLYCFLCASTPHYSRARA